MARITIEDCLEKINNHFKLVLVAGHRAQQLQSGYPPRIEVGNEKPTLIALREIAEGAIGEDILDEPLMYDATAEEELAELIANGLMDQEVSTELGDIAEDVEEDEETVKDPLETGPETIEQMEKMADLNLDHLTGGDDTPSNVNSALADKLSESEVVIGEELLNKVGEAADALADETAGETASEAADEAAGEAAESESSEAKPA